MVGDEREVSAQLDHAGQLAPVLAGLADRMSGCFIYGEHGRSLDLPAWQEQAEDGMDEAERDDQDRAASIGTRGRGGTGAPGAKRPGWSK